MFLPIRAPFPAGRPDHAASHARSGPIARPHGPPGAGIAAPTGLNEACFRGNESRTAAAGCQ